MDGVTWIGPYTTTNTIKANKRRKCFACFSATGYIVIPARIDQKLFNSYQFFRWWRRPFSCVKFCFINEWTKGVQSLLNVIDKFHILKNATAFVHIIYDMLHIYIKGGPCSGELKSNMFYSFAFKNLTENQLENTR